MGDISAEPSMEEILSSIKRIIAEESEPAPARPRRSARLAPAPVEPPLDEPEDDDDDRATVLELSEPMPAGPDRSAADRPAAAAAPERSPPPVEADMAAAPIVSQQTLAATRGALDTLSRLVTRPEPGSDGTLEGLVREMLRPMLRDWLDANLPALVERIVASEVAKIVAAR